MSKTYLHFLFFCGILCQGIFAALSDEDNSLSSDSLIRKRRVINHLPGGRRPTQIEDVKYIVKIKENNRAICAGAILSRHTIITAASCVHHPQLPRYQIFSGAAGNVGNNVHNVIAKVSHSGNLPYHVIDGISLVTVDPPFVYTPRTGNIQLHVGPVPAGTMLTTYGWGYTYPLQPGPELRMRLRSISLPILNNTECQNIYQDRFEVSEKYICTCDEHQYCAKSDAGAPLVFHNSLVGIHVWKGSFSGHRNPDVYINLMRPEFIEWIRNNRLLLL